MRIFKYWKSLSWTILILLATTLPSSAIPKSPLLKIPHFDKIVHFGLFFVLTLLLLSETNQLRKQGKLSSRAITLGLLISVMYGLAIELLQHFVFTSRSGSFLDFAANVAGALAAIALYRLVNRITRQYI